MLCQDMVVDAIPLHKILKIGVNCYSLSTISCSGCITETKKKYLVAMLWQERQVLVQHVWTWGNLLWALFTMECWSQNSAKWLWAHIDSIFGGTEQSCSLDIAHHSHQWQGLHVLESILYLASLDWMHCIEASELLLFWRDVWKSHMVQTVSNPSTKFGTEGSNHQCFLQRPVLSSIVAYVCLEIDAGKVIQLAISNTDLQTSPGIPWEAQKCFHEMLLHQAQYWHQ